jgi:hypothetical protein
MAASPSYLSSQGVEIDHDTLRRAKSGERVFLLPDTWGATEKKLMEGWLDENSRIDYEPSITTEYFNESVVRFEQYSPKTPLFMWNVDPALQQSAAEAVVLILTPENMIPFESESLAAVGLENSYIKLDGTAAQRFTNTSYLSQFNLDDNEPEFLPVSEFIAGLKKTIQNFLSLFATVAFFLCTFCLVTLITLMKIFSTTYRESLAVKRMLGYSLARIFAPAIALIGITSFLAILSVILLESTSAILANLIMLLIQALMLTLLTKRYSQLQLSSALKE